MRESGASAPTPAAARQPAHAPLREPRARSGAGRFAALLTAPPAPARAANAVLQVGLLVGAILWLPHFGSAAPRRTAVVFGCYWAMRHMYAIVRPAGEGSAVRGALVDTVAFLLMTLMFPRLAPYMGIAVIAHFMLVATAASLRFSAALHTVGLVLYVGAQALRGTPIDYALLVGLVVFVPATPVMITRIKARERRLHGKYEHLVNSLDAVVWEADPITCTITFISPRLAELLDVEPGLGAGTVFEYVHSDDWMAHLVLLRDLVRDGQRADATYRVSTRTTGTRWVHDAISVERDTTGRAVVLRGVITDVTYKHENEERVRRQASTDPLTGLANRAEFMRILETRLADRRHRFALLLLDLNGFKEVNDTLGHAVGDQLLTSVAGRFTRAVPSAATVARLGGDEFAILAPGLGPAEAERLAAEVSQSLADPVVTGAMRIQTAGSIGVALFPVDGTNPATLLRRADAAMYDAKRGGRPFQRASGTDDSRSVDRIRLLGELRSAIDNGELRLYHQPKVDLRSAAVVGSEALLRWAHPKLGNVEPNRFIDVAELSGLITPLTTWVIEEAVRQMREWDELGLTLSVAVNVSVQNVLDQEVPKAIGAALAAHRIDGGRLTLEITERQVMSDRSQARRALDRFRALGVRIAVDDFGTGYSSLSQLRLLHADEIKIDTTFVQGMLADEHDAAIVRSIIELGHNLGLEVVAEGAESAAHLRALRDLGADRAQGYAIAAPMPAEAFRAWVERIRATGTPRMPQRA